MTNAKRENSRPAVTIELLPGLIFQALRTMDQEAAPRTPDGPATGLSDYGRHARPDLSKPQAEVEWSRRLAVLMRDIFPAIDTEVRYPAYALPEGRRRQQCDLVIELPDRERVWLEVKGAWRDYWGGKSGIYRCYLLHPLEDYSSLGKSHTVPFDLEKLRSLRAPEANYVGELLIGFEHPDDPMDQEIQSLIELATLFHWSSGSDSWLSPSVPNQRVRAWLWYRAIGSHAACDTTK